MLDQNDLEQIGKIVRVAVKEEFSASFNAHFKPAFDAAFKESFRPAFMEAFGEVWEYNLEPAFNYVHEKIDKHDAWLIRLDGKVDKLAVCVSQLPTKQYIDDKIRGLRTEVRQGRKNY
jgi:hypothetical protein